MDIGKRIRDLREKRGLTQREVARRAGLTPSGVGFIEHGQTRNPSAETVVAIARALGVRVEELLAAVEPAPPSAVQIESEEPALAGKAEAPGETGRAEWDAAVRRARRLRMRSRIDMENALASWQESKERGEPSDARRGVRAEMGELLQEAYDTAMALWRALRTHRFDLVDLDEFAEFQAADRFYFELFRLVQRAGLSPRPDGAQEGEPAQAGQPEVEAHTVGETEAA